MIGLLLAAAVGLFVLNLPLAQSFLQRALEEVE